MYDIQELIAAAMLMVTTKPGQNIGPWRKMIGVFIMITLGSVGGIAGAIVTLRINEAVLEQRVIALEQQQSECVKNLRQHELSRDIHQ